MLGAGDAFMSGFLRGWLRDEPHRDLLRLRQCLRRLRGVAAPLLAGISDLSRDAALPRQGIVAQGRALRRGAQPHPLGDDAPRAAGPDHGARHRSPRAARNDRRRRRRPARAHRRVQAAGGRGRRARRQGAAGLRHAARRRYGREALFRADELGFWIGRPVEEPGSRPLDFEFGGSSAPGSIEWPVSHTIKCLCFYHPDDAADMKARQERELLRLYDAARRIRPRVADRDHRRASTGPSATTRSPQVIARLYEIGIKPDWWKLEGQTPAAWSRIDAAIAAGDPLCRGVMVLGLEAPEDELAAAFRAARGSARGEGFRRRAHDLRRAGAALVFGAGDGRGRGAEHGGGVRAALRALGGSNVTGGDGLGMLQEGG